MARRAGVGDPRRLPPVASATTSLLLALAGLLAVYRASQFSPFTLGDALQVSVERVAATIVIVAGAVVPLILAASLELPNEPMPASHSGRAIALPRDPHRDPRADSEAGVRNVRRVHGEDEQGMARPT